MECPEIFLDVFFGKIEALQETSLSWWDGWLKQIRIWGRKKIFNVIFVGWMDGWMDG